MTTTTTSYPEWDGVRPLDWYHLMRQAEAFRDETRWGLASVWAYINRRDYDGARRELDRAINGYRDLTKGTTECTT